jgi:uncharacterized protein YbjQ (UPF0145 family)
MEALVVLLLQIGIPLLFILLGLFVGRARERAHFADLERREQALAGMLVSDIRSFPGGADPQHTPTIVVGATAIATDYLKSWLAGFRKILGGELRSYHSLMDRARREAMLRIMEQAHRQGYDAICNLRLDTADIGGAIGPKGVVMVAMVASGTAYKRPAIAESSAA